MTTLSTFRINQPQGTPGPAWDRSRRDIDLYSVASERVECEATNKAETTYLWEMISAPDGVSVTINASTTHTCDFPVDTRGSYLIRLTVDAGLVTESKTTLFFSVPLQYTGLCLPAMNETNQDNSQSPYDGARGFEDKLNAFLVKLDEVAGQGVIRKKAVIDIVDCTAAPPTEVTGDRYILDFTGGTVHANWDGAAKGDIVQFKDNVWNAETPSEGWVTYVDLQDADYRYVDDGSPAWEAVVSTVTLQEARDNGNTISGLVDITATGLSPALRVYGLSDTALYVSNQTNAQPIAIFADNITSVLTIGNGGAFDFDALTFDVDATGAITFDAAAASNFTTSSGTLSLDGYGGLSLDSANGEVTVDDVNRDGSTVSAALKISENTAEWDAFEVAFGEVSILNALEQAKSKTFDDTITSSSIAGSGGTWDREIDIDIIKSGNVQIVELDISVGTSADTIVELYDADPAGAGVLIYQAGTPTTGLDIPTNGKHSDPNIWWAEVAVTGSLWARITNNGASATTYTLRVRMRDDNTTEFTE